jgi:hypothetical protein
LLVNYRIGLGQAHVGRAQAEGIVCEFIATYHPPDDAATAAIIRHWDGLAHPPVVGIHNKLKYHIGLVQAHVDLAQG